MQLQIPPHFSVSYQEKGQGRPLVFLHAFPLSSAMWGAQIDEFSSEFRVLAPNFRGIGQTTNFQGPPSLQTLAQDVFDWLKALEIEEEIVLCGLSMGGYVALEFARAFPEKLAALILCDTRADADSEEARKNRDEMMFFARQNDGRAVAQKMLPKLLLESTPRDKPEVADQVLDIAAENSGGNLARLVQAMRDRRDSTPILPNISVPTLVLGGAQDSVSPPPLMALMAAAIPGARHVIIDGAGHLSNLEQNENFNAALRQFLKTRPA